MNDERSFSDSVAAGEIAFARWMSAALYGPNGYYTKHVHIGEAGADFYTAAQSRLFAQTVARAVCSAWHTFGEPSRLQVVEFGGGQGELAAHLLEALFMLLPEVELRYRIQEVSPALMAVQQAAVANRCLKAAQSLHSRPDSDVPTVIVANELLDAFPVERVKRTQTGWLQGYVKPTATGSDLVWRGAESNVAAFADRFVDCPVDTQAEVCLTYSDFFSDAFAMAEDTHLIVFDYGISTAEWQSGVRPNGTVRAYRRHELVDVLTDAGLADITADVNWDAAADAATGAGWQALPLSSQGSFLMAHGILDIMKDLSARISERDRHRLTNAFKHLVLPGGLGERFCVFQCQKTKRKETGC